MDRPSWRKPFGVFLILLLILALCIAVSAVAGRITALPWYAQVPVFLVLGLVWITPLKPLLRWMEAAPRG